MGKFKGKSKLKGTLKDKNGNSITSGTWTQSEVSKVIRSSHNPATSFVGEHCGTGVGVTLTKYEINAVRYR